MPLWQIFHPVGTFDNKDAKQALAEDITKMYTELDLPAFYVVAQFIPLPVQDIWIGGDTRASKPFIRVVINHVALNMPDEDAVYKHATSRIDTVLKPHISDKDYDWEYHVGETDRRLWKINGMIPPPYRSEEEQEWVKENRAIPYDGAYWKPL